MKQPVRTSVLPVVAALLMGVPVQSMAQTDSQSTTQAIAPTTPDRNDATRGAIVFSPDSSNFSANEFSFGNAIESICPGLVPGQGPAPRQDLQKRCTELVVRGLSSNGGANGKVDSLTTDLRELNTDEAAAQGRGLTEFMSIRSIAVAARLQRLRLADAGTGTGETIAFNNRLGTLDYGFETGGGAGDDDFGRWSIYANGGLATGDRDTTPLEAGYDLDGGRITVGADYRVSNNLFVGASLDYISNSADFTNNSSLDTDGVDVTLYGTSYTDSGIYLEGTIGFGSNDYKQKRRFSYTIPAFPGPGLTVINQTATGDTSGNQFFASAGLGKDLNLGGGITGGVSATLDYLDASIDGFTETISGGAPGFGMGLTVNDQDVTSLRSTLGARVSKAISTESGVVAPFANFNWIHEFDNDSRSIIASLASAPTGSTAFRLTTDDPDADYFRLGGGVSAVFAQGLQAFVSLDAVLGLDRSSYYGVTAGIRKEL